MGNKRNIGLIVHAKDNWAGGIYYIKGILNVLSNSEQNIYLLIENREYFRKWKLEYNSIKYIKYKRNIIDRLVFEISNYFPRLGILYMILFHSNFLNKINALDVIFPVDVNIYFKYLKKEKLIYWIPDFQENYYPSYFSIREIYSRLKCQATIAYSESKVILSSDCAKNDYIRLFPKSNAHISILKFTSSARIGKLDQIGEDILLKYSINKPFYICSNQFWFHKNHFVILQAVKWNCDNNIPINYIVLFTGKEDVYNQGTINKDKLYKYCKDNNILEYVKFLGFIPRDDQLLLMRKSLAIIQPSLFEGWNTTVEDGKLLSVPVILSDIDVHYEQISEKGIFFRAKDYIQLSKIMNDHSVNNCEAIDYNYKKDVNLYKSKILDTFVSNVPNNNE